MTTEVTELDLNGGRQVVVNHCHRHNVCNWVKGRVSSGAKHVYRPMSEAEMRECLAGVRSGFWLDRWTPRQQGRTSEKNGGAGALV